jgi:hypothetical protein
MVAVFLHERGAGRHQPEGAACKNVASRQARGAVDGISGSRRLIESNPSAPASA